MGRALAEAGHVVRTGGSPGADRAYAQGAAAAGGRVELVVPWAGFAPDVPAAVTVTLDEDAHADWVALARDASPDWEALGPPRRRLLARNAGIVGGGHGLGPAALCVAVHRGPTSSGGTAHALRMAAALGVPVLATSENRPPAQA